MYNAHTNFEAMRSVFLRTITTWLMAAGAACCATAANEEAPSPQDLFQQALPLLEAKDFAGARPLLEQARLELPDDPSLLWNLGIVYSELEEHEQALAAWLKIAKLEPGNWHVTAKVVQAYQGLNRATERDAAIKQLLAERKKDKQDQRPWFCREQFRLDGKEVLALQFFEPKSPRRVYYAFVVTGPDGSEACRLSLGSYDATTEIARSLGEVEPKARLYHLDYYEDGGHQTYGFFKKLPTYDEIRSRVFTILTESPPPISSSRTVGAEPQDDSPPPPGS